MRLQGVSPNEPGVPLVGEVARGRLEEIGPGSLRARAARGTVVNAVWLIGVSSLSLAKGLVVAAMLGVEAYGLWGLLTASFGTLFALGAVGFDDKYIQQDHPDQQAAFEIAFTLQMALGGLFMLIGLATMPLFALLYDQPDILWPGMVLSLAFPLLALETPVWVFYRRMQFVKQRLLQSVGPVVSFVVTILLALAGADLWALVIGSAAGSVAAAWMAIANSPYRLRFRYERGAVREYASFSWPLMFGAFAAVLAGQIPITIASRSLGATAIGVIALAMTITAYTRRVDDIVTQTLYPAICAVKDRTDALFESFSKSNRLALLWGFPCGIALALFAADLVRFVLGEEWKLAVPVIQVLGVAAAVDQLGFNWTAFARARGETRPLAVGALATLITMVGAGVPLLLLEGLIGYAVALALATMAVLVVRTAYLLKLFPALKLARHVSRAILPTLPAASVILLERTLVAAGEGPARVVVEVAAYAGLVIAGTLIAERALLREAAGYLRRAPAPMTPATG